MMNLLPNVASGAGLPLKDFNWMVISVLVGSETDEGRGVIGKLRFIALQAMFTIGLG